MSRIDLGFRRSNGSDQTIRVAPPLVVTADQVDWMVEQFGTALTEG